MNNIYVFKMNNIYASKINNIYASKKIEIPINFQHTYPTYLINQCVSNGQTKKNVSSAAPIRGNPTKSNMTKLYITPKQ